MRLGRKNGTVNDCDHTYRKCQVCTFQGLLSYIDSHPTHISCTQEYTKKTWLAWCIEGQQSYKCRSKGRKQQELEQRKIMSAAIWERALKILEALRLWKLQDKTLQPQLRRNIGDLVKHIIEYNSYLSLRCKQNCIRLKVLCCQRIKLWCQYSPVLQRIDRPPVNIQRIGDRLLIRTGKSKLRSNGWTMATLIHSLNIHQCLQLAYV